MGKELEFYQLVNSCETIEQLKSAIMDIASQSTPHHIQKEGGFLIEGRDKFFDAYSMSRSVEGVVKGELSPNYLTRKYGIRQQALYLREYSKY